MAMPPFVITSYSIHYTKLYDVAGFGMMQVMMYAIPAYIAGDGDMTADIEQLLRWASFVLTLPVVFYSAAPFFQRAARDRITSYNVCYTKLLRLICPTNISAI